VVQGHVATDYGWLVILCKPARSGGDEPGIAAIGDRGHKRRTLNTRLSSGTSAGTFACSAGPYTNGKGEAGTKNEPNWYFVPDQKRGPKIDPHVSNLRSRWFLFQGVQVHPYSNHMCDVTHSYVCRDSFVCVPWLIHMCAMTHFYVVEWFTMQVKGFICVTFLICMCAATHLYVCREPFLYSGMIHNGIWTIHT